MEERKVPPGTSDGGGSGGGGESSRPPASHIKLGDRQIFNLELRPGETTIVSWKKLTKDANEASGSNSVPDPPVNTRPNFEAHIAPEQPDENELTEASHTNRFSAVIEKIERLYVGKDSSDDEDLLDVPDDDQYDTEDSFIDDAELDEYFEVDNSAIKHDGFFVNRGKLERLNVQPQLPSQQPRKRQRKDLVKNNREDDYGHGSNKHLKVSKPQASNLSLLPGKNSFNSSHNWALSSEDCEESKSQDKLNTSSSKTKSAEGKQTMDPTVSPQVSNCDATATLVEVKDVDRQNLGVLQSKDIREKCKDTGGSMEVTHQKYHVKSTFMNSKSQHGRPLSVVLGLENSYSSKERNGKNELPDLNLIDGKPSVQAIKSQYTQRKDGPRPKSSMLEKAIRELEKMVAESRPPTGENQEADSSQAVKRRLPREIKLKLAKVARLAQASHGKVSKELINRLMNILGHLIQLRTLKRNLKEMITTGLSEKQETNDRFQQVKKEVVEMIKMQAPSLESKGIQQLGGICGDFQELGSEKGSSKKKFCMDTVLEDKICELYDLFVDGLDEDAAPQVRKLYAELAQLWPYNTMDNYGIKRAIIRAKERRGAMHSRHKDHIKIKRRKMLTPREMVPVRGEPSSVRQQQIREKVTPESGYLGSNPAPNITNAGVRVPSYSTSASIDRLKPEKIKGSSGGHGETTRVVGGTLIKKKVKRKPELDMNRSLLRSEKPPALEEESQRPP